jgi:hypothetical protein
MTSASLALRKQTGFIDPSTSPELAAESVDLDKFLVDVVNDSAPGFDIRAAITDGYIERTIDGASTLSVTIHDSDMVLLKSGLFGDGTEDRFPAIDVNVDGLWFRLVQISKSGSDIVLTFEDRWVAWLRLKKKPRKASRNDVTRAHFVRTLVREVKRNGGLEFYSPDIDKKRPIAKAKDPAERKKNRDPGLPRLAGGGSLPSGFTFIVKGARATQTQMDTIEKILDTGLHLGANRKCMVASIMAAIQESTLKTTATNGSHVGIFQQDSTPGSVWRNLGGATRDVIKDSTAFFKVAIDEEKKDKHISHEDLAEAVERSGQGSLYAQWQSEAIAFVDAYDNHGGFIKGGSASADETTTSADDPSNTYGKQYEFHRGPPDGDANENTWTCAERLAEEVRWRRFIVGNRFYFLSDFMLIQAGPSMTITEDTDGVDFIDFDMDAGKPVAEAVVKCRASRWFAPPGTIVAVDELGSANGRWICYTIHRNLFSSDCEITLRQPEHSKKEPATEIVTRSSTSIDESGGTGSKSDIVAAAQKALKLGPSKYHYKQVRPLPHSLFAAGDIYTDCSGFAALCYKAAGAADPNGVAGNNYKSGFTGTLWSNGNHISADRLEPGDLVFYGDPNATSGHVAVYIGGGRIIGMGGDPDPTESDMHYRTPTGYRSYNLDGST